MSGAMPGSSRWYGCLLLPLIVIRVVLYGLYLWLKEICR